MKRKLGKNPAGAVPRQGPRRGFGADIVRLKKLVGKIVKVWADVCENDPVLDSGEMRSYCIAKGIERLEKGRGLPYPNTIRDWCREYMRSCGYRGDNTGGAFLDESGRWCSNRFLRPSIPPGDIDTFRDADGCDVSVHSDEDWQESEEEQLETIAYHRQSRNDPHDFHRYDPAARKSDLREEFWDLVAQDPDLMGKLQDISRGYTLRELAKMWDLRDKYRARYVIRNDLREQLEAIDNGKAVALLKRLAGIPSNGNKQEKGVSTPDKKQ